jgi:hypothetical protein
MLATLPLECSRSHPTRDLIFLNFNLFAPHAKRSHMLQSEKDLDQTDQQFF